jgi:hypothetical protein
MCLDGMNVYYDFAYGIDKLLSSVENSCDYFGVEDYTTVQPWEKYEWVSHRCRLLDWNAQQFCDLLGSRRVILLGDSLSGQTASTLINMISYNNASCGHQIFYIRRNHLTRHLSRVVHEKFKGATLVDVYLHLLDHFYYSNEKIDDILVMNAGAHLQSVSELQLIFNDLNSQNEELRRVVMMKNSSSRLSFAWRSQTPGHYQCEFPKNTDFNYPDTAFMNDIYRYNMYPVLDAVARKGAATLNMTWIDTFPLWDRSEAHPGGAGKTLDCLHYVLPGALDIFPVLLFQHLYNGDI